MLIVLTGKTASGKDTLIAKILQKYPDFKKVLTSTSRMPRESEVNGVDYNFISRDEFKQKITRGKLLEYVEYGGNYYGTEKSQIREGEDLIWKIDPSMAGKVRELIKNNLLVIYITTSDEVILERLKKRGLSEQEIQKRMADDKKIWEEYKNNYDFVVENVTGKLDKTIEKVINLINSQIRRQGEN